MPFLPIVASKLSKELGYGMPLSSKLASVAFAVCLFVYLYVIGSFFKITVYPLINRVIFYVVFQEHVINEHVDYIIAIVATTSWFLFSVRNRAIRYSFSTAYGGIGIVFAIVNPDNIIFHIIALVSLPLVVSFVLYHRKARKDILNFNLRLTLQYISVAVVGISTIGIVISVVAVFLPAHFDSPSADSSHANELFLLLSSFSTVYIFLLIFCLPVKVLFKEILRILKLDVKEDISQTISNNSHEQNNNNNNKGANTQTKIGLLSLAMILSVVLVLIPQHPSINKDNQDIGVDTRFYATWIGELAKSKSVSDLIYQAFIITKVPVAVGFEEGQDGDRPLSLIFMFLVYQVAGGNLSEVLEHFPLILGPGLVLALYFLTLELTRNEKIALIAAFLGAVSFHTLIGIYAGFYANWLALIVGYISIVFLFRYLRSGRPPDIVVFSILLIGILFLHVYTWRMLTIVAGTFLVAMLVVILMKKNSSNNNHFTSRRIILTVLAILLSIALDITKVVLTGSSGGVVQDLELTQTNLGIEQFDLRQEILNATMHDSLGGVFSNFIILGLGLIWVVKSNMREPATVFLIIFLSAGLVPLFFGDWAIQARVFYNIPFEIPAAISLFYISRRSDSILVTLAGCTWLVAASIVTVMNYYLILVPGVE